MINRNEVPEQFKNAIHDALGYSPEFIIADKQLHRFKDDSGKLNGAYVLHTDGRRPAGYYQDFKQGIKENWKTDGDFIPLSAFQRQVFKAQCWAQEIERQQAEVAKHRAAAAKAVYIRNSATPAPANHPYFIKKHIGIHGARSGRDNTLIIPLYNSKNEIVNLQFISESGGKRFLSGGQKKGCFYILAGNMDKVLICEGLATGASLQESTGFMTVVAFDAGNLKEVAINIRTLHPGAEIIIAGDNDESGIGQKKAIEAALSINGKYIIPATPGHDWNDSLNMEVKNA